MAKEIKVKVCTNDIEKEITVEAGSTLQEILAQVDSETNVYVAAVVDKRLKELTWKLYKDTTVKYLDIGTPIGHDLYKRSVVLLMLRAFQVSMASLLHILKIHLPCIRLL